MTHALARRRGATRNEAGNRLLEVFLDPGCSLLFGWNLGTWLSVGMIVFAGAAILYDTSKILHHYEEDRYVAAALELFASVALMFWYVLQLFMSRD